MSGKGAVAQYFYFNVRCVDRYGHVTRGRFGDDNQRAAGLGGDAYSADNNCYMHSRLFLFSFFALVQHYAEPLDVVVEDLICMGKLLSRRQDTRRFRARRNHSIAAVGLRASAQSLKCKCG